MAIGRIATVTKAWTQIIGLPAGMLALAVAAFSVTQKLSEANRTFKLHSIAALSEARKLFAEYEKYTQAEAEFNKAQQLSPKELEQLLAQYGSGQALYNLPRFKDFRAVKGYFDSIAIYVRYDYLDFNLVFEMLSFPDTFWEKSTDLRRVIRDNWYGPGRPLKDFDRNVDWLYARYKEAREKL